MLRFSIVILAIMLVNCGGGIEPAAPGTAPQAPRIANVATEVRLEGRRINYTVDPTPLGTIVRRPFTGEAQVHSADVKRIYFQDVALALDIDGNAGAVYRLYQAAFDRQPDLGGMGYQLAAIDNGQNDLAQLAANFIASPEFTSRYGPLDDRAFVTQLYANVLKRSPDAEGLTYYLDRLASGALTRKDVLVGFAQSPENRALVADSVAHGIEYVPLGWPLPAAPLPVLRSSYENRAFAGEVLGSIERPPTSLPAPFERLTGSIAFADFFQEGQLSAVAFSTQEDMTSLLGLGPTWTAGRAYFFKMTPQGWVDETASLLHDVTGCIGTGKVLIVDFNGDRRPDIFVSCSGHDEVVNGQLPGEHPRILLSQPDGTYTNQPFPLNCYCNATAADFSGDGYADLIVNDTRSEGLVQFRNLRDGTFAADRSRLPVSTMNFGNNFTHPMVALELLDAYGTGHYDLFTGGGDMVNCNCNYDWHSRVYRNSGDNTWSDDQLAFIPQVPGRADVYDVLVKNGKLYLLRWDWGGSPAASDDAMTIQRVTLSDLSSTILFDHVGTFSDGVQTTLAGLIFRAGSVRGLYTYPDVGVAE